MMRLYVLQTLANDDSLFSGQPNKVTATEVTPFKSSTKLGKLFLFYKEIQSGSKLHTQHYIFKGKYKNLTIKQTESAVLSQISSDSEYNNLPT